MYSLGVDIGTTSVVAAVDRGGGAEVVVLGGSSVVVPALVHRHDDGTLRTGEAAARRALATPHRVATRLTHRLVEGTPVVLGEHQQSVTTLLCAVLRDVLDVVRAREGGDPERVVLTRPTAWGAFREELFAQVPARLGWDDAGLVSDAVAALEHHRRRGGPVAATTVVHDVGGGSVDTTVLHTGDGEPTPLGTPESREDLAGGFADAVLALVRQACGGALDREPSSPAEATALARLRRECALAVEALTHDAEVLVPVVLDGRPRDVEVTRADLEARIRPTVDAGVESLLRTVRAAGLDPADPDVLLVGGAARVPLVARRLSGALGRPVVADPQAPWAAALGAASLGADAGPRDRTRVPEGPFRSWTPPRGLVPMAPVVRVEDDPEVTQHVDDPDVTQRLPPRPEPPDEPVEETPEEPVEQPAPPLEPDFRPVARPRRRRPTAVAVAVVVVVVLALAGVWVATATPTPAAPPAAAPALAAPVLPAALAPGPTSVAASVPSPRLRPGSAGPTTAGYAAVSPNGRVLYLADRVAGAVTAVDTADPASRVPIAVDAGPPRYLAVSPDGRRAYVSVWDDARTVAAVVVIDTVTRSVVATVPVRSRPFGLAVSPDGRTVWVPNQDTANVSVIDTASATVVRDVALSSNPHWAAFSRDGARVYVSLEDDDQVVELDPATDREISRVPTGTGPFRVAVHPTRPLAAEVDYAGNTVTAFDTEQNRRVATIPVGRFPQDLAWAPDGRFAYVVDTTDATVSVIDAATFAVTATVATPPRPTSIAVAPDGRTAWVTCEGALAVLDLATS